MVSMKRSKKGKAATNQEGEASFQVRQGHLLQLVKRLDGHTSEGNNLVFRTGGRDLVGIVGKVVLRPLAEFDSEDKVSTFVKQLVEISEPAAK